MVHYYYASLFFYLKKKYIRSTNPRICCNMKIQLRLILFFAFVFAIYDCSSQNEPNVNPGLSIKRQTIPFVNLHNGQLLDSIHFYMKDPEFLSKRNYNYFNSLGLKVKSISFSRNKELNKWWQSFEGTLSYNENQSLMKEVYIHLKVYGGKPLILTFEKVYDSLSNFINENYFFWNIDRKFIRDFGQMKYSYAENGMLNKMESHSWRGHFELEYSHATTDYSYFEDGKLREHIISFYWEREDKLKPTSRQTYSYDENGNIGSEFYDQWDREKDEWKLFSKKVYLSESNLTQQIDGYVFNNGIWEKHSNKYYFYDDRKLVQYIEKKLDDPLKKILNSKKETFEYNDNNLLITHIRSQWDTSLNDWVPKYQTSWSYNDYGNISEINYFNQSNENVMKLRSRMLYFWNSPDTTEISKKYETVKLCKVYPNPVTDRLTIEVMSDKTFPIAYCLTKISGEQVLSGLIRTGSYSIGMDKLASEIYILILQSGNGVQTEKIFKY